MYPDLNGTQDAHYLPDAAFKIIDLTVSGVAGGNGTFTQGDFFSFYFAANSPLNYSAELIGQSMANGCTFGSFGACYGGSSGDFNLFGQTANAPNGYNYFQLSTTGGDFLDVTSMSAVPEPATWLMMIAGFGVVGGAMRSAKRRSAVKFEAKIKRIAAGATA